MVSLTPTEGTRSRPFLPRYDWLVAVEKLSVSVEPALARRMRAAASARGRSLSAFVAEAVEHRLKLEAAEQLLGEWEAEHGAVTDVERERVRSRWPV